MQHLTAIYDTRIAEGTLRRDLVQRAILETMEVTRERLQTPAVRSSGLLARFRGASPQSAEKQGVYLWGGVGRGKSMLMDMFHAHVGIAEKRRVHFHAFMQDLQSDLRSFCIQDLTGP